MAEKNKFIHILCIEDDAGVQKSLELAIGDLYEVHFCKSAEEGLNYLAKGEPADAATLDIYLPGIDGIKALSKIKALRPELAVIMLSAVIDIQVGVKAIKLGAYDYIVKPFSINELRPMIARILETESLRRKNIALMKEVSGRFHPDHLIGVSQAMKQIREKIAQASEGMTPVLITGETGTGKELVAKAIHYTSERKASAFVAVNCAALPRELVESELFGHEKGAFTGAVEKRLGAFEQAQGGTLFLDEIGELEAGVQAKLLRVLEDKDLKRLGGTNSIHLDIRLISATNKDLETAIQKNEFRKDLFYRLCVFPVHLPGLRERKEDIPLLMEYWANHFQREMGLEVVPKFTPALIHFFKERAWEGNVRELKNVLEAILLGQRRSRPLELDTIHWPYAQSFKNMSKNSTETDDHEISSLKEYLENAEKNFIRRALERSQQDRTKTARLLGITPRMLRYRMKQLNLG